MEALPTAEAPRPNPEEREVDPDEKEKEKEKEKKPEKDKKEEKRKSQHHPKVHSEPSVPSISLKAISSTPSSYPVAPLSANHRSAPENVPIYRDHRPSLPFAPSSRKFNVGAEAVEVYSSMLFECTMEVKMEATATGKKVKHDEWHRMLVVLDGQQIVLYGEASKKSELKREPSSAMPKSKSLYQLPKDLDDEKEVFPALDESVETQPLEGGTGPIVRSTSFGGTSSALEANEALKRISRSSIAYTDDEIGVSRKGSLVRTPTRRKSADEVKNILEESRMRSRSEISNASKVALVPTSALSIPEHVISLSSAELKDVEDKNKKLLSFKIESEWDGTFSFRSSVPEEYHKMLKELITALEWSKKASLVDDKGLARTSHCIPHRFATESTLLKRCRFCGKIIAEFRGYRCIHCGDCFHIKCGKYAPPNCGLSSMREVLNMIPIEGKSGRKITDTVNSRLKNKGDNIFGVELSQQPPTEDGIPVIVKLCINAIEQRGMDSIGIYRVSGIKSEIERLRVYFCFGRPNLIDVDQWNDVNVISGVLKAWFRELPTPLMTYDLFDEFTALPKKGKVDTAELQEVLTKLPPQNYAILKYLMGHLNRVALLSHENKMQPENLAALFGPNLLRSREEKDSELSLQLSVMRHMIVEYNAVFEHPAGSDPLP